MDLQGFLSRNLVNISEALTVLLASPRRLQGVRRCVRILTAAAVRRREREKEEASAASSLFTGSGREKPGINTTGEKKEAKRSKTKQKVQRRRKRRPRAPSIAKFAPLDVLQQLLLL